ncbi:phosphoadenosine phosphosulfate reductase family protein [Pseudomonas syringae]|uniref:phosphoadenosine phosphosulfate reductase domain-containing protein n=1 Tax=Pseudomonas syringae TaxID=317 RepID=UPI001F24FCC8|nr:phosphoadenosine phosphosulfate reductase family protein [Pseudomonas syringae]
MRGSVGFDSEQRLFSIPSQGSHKAGTTLQWKQDRLLPKPTQRDKTSKPYFQSWVLSNYGEFVMAVDDTASSPPIITQSKPTHGSIVMGVQQTIQLVDVTDPSAVQIITPAPVVEMPLNEKVSIAVKAIKLQILTGKNLCAMWSGGKDSSVTLSLALMAMHELVQEGVKVPTLHVCHSDTLMENPVVVAYNETQIAQMEQYAKTNGVPMKVWVASPGLSTDYLVSVIGGRTIISVGNNTKCQQSTKAYPLAKLKRQVRRQIALEAGVKPKAVEIVSLIGTRFDESAARNRAMTERGESALVAIDTMDDGQLVLSPIAHFTTMDVFGFIGDVRAGRIATYSDFEDLLELYRSMNGGECAVVAYLGNREQAKTPCNARTGCWTCARVSRDVSAESLIATEGDKYKWMKPLNDLRAFMIKMHFNPSARAWLARDIDENGWIAISPNAYSPTYTSQLLGIVLSIQADEETAARKLGIKPRFKLLSLKQIMAIELAWGRYGYQSAWTAMKLYKAVTEDGQRFRIPDLDSMPTYTEKDVAFRARVPFTDGHFDGMFSGLRNVDAAAADCEDLTTTRDGTYVTRVQVGNEYDIDDEGLELFMEFELDRVLDSKRLNDTPSAAVHYLLGLGTVNLFKGSHSDWDRMLRISNQLERHSLRPILHDPHAVIAHLSAKHAAVHGPSLDFIVATATPPADNIQGSLFTFPKTAAVTPAPAPQEHAVQEQGFGDHETQYAAAIEQIMGIHSGEFQMPAMGMMLAHCCELLSRQRLTHHTFESFMALWIDDTGSLLDEQGPIASAYEPIVKMAYAVLLGNGLIL